MRRTGGRVKQGELTAVRLQETEAGTGRTDVEVETEFLRLVIEAKRGWAASRGTGSSRSTPTRLNTRDGREGRIVVVAECAEHFPPLAAMPAGINGVPITYVPWSRVAAARRPDRGMPPGAKRRSGYCASSIATSGV